MVKILDGAFIEARRAGSTGLYLMYQCEARGIGVSVKEDWVYCPWCGERISTTIESVLAMMDKYKLGEKK